MSRYTSAYTSTCNMCLWTKPSCQVPVGKLHLLPIPKERWSVVPVDFISEVLDVHSYDTIMVIVESVEKRAHFIPTTTTCSVLGAANLYCKNIWKLHGLSNAFVSD